MISLRARTVGGILFVVLCALLAGLAPRVYSALPVFLRSCLGSPWPSEIEEVSYASSADGTLVPALFYAPGVDAPAPLLVGMHTWSGTRRDPHSRPFAAWCIEKGWNLILPEYRGPNDRPEATGSRLALGDISSAVRYAMDKGRVDSERIYLVGVSGGAHAALLAAEEEPHVWAGVSVWASVTDLEAWYLETKESHPRFAEDIERSCGGSPLSNPRAKEDCARRSPITYARPFAWPAIDLNAGILDGHTGSVRISHSLRMFNALAFPDDRLDEGELTSMVVKRSVPDHLRYPGSDPLYGNHRVLFRRVSGNARITVFDGGHMIIYPAALNWLASQRRPPPPAV